MGGCPLGQEQLGENLIIHLLSDSCILYDHQYEFRGKNDYRNCAFAIVDKITTYLDNYSLGIFLDLSKVFEKVNFKILLN